MSGTLLNKYENRIINFHPALLPMYPGRKAIDQAIENGHTLLVGNTAHFIDEGMDTGPIIMQSVIPLQAFFNANDNYDVILDLQIEMLNKIITLLKTERITVLGNKVTIIGADYGKSSIFPTVNVDEFIL